MTIFVTFCWWNSLNKAWSNLVYESEVLSTAWSYSVVLKRSKSNDPSDRDVSDFIMMGLRNVGSRTFSWTQISSKGMILDKKHDELKVLWIFENFGKFWNTIWVAPMARVIFNTNKLFSQNESSEKRHRCYFCCRALLV